MIEPRPLALSLTTVLPQVALVVLLAAAAQAKPQYATSYGEPGYQAAPAFAGHVEAAPAAHYAAPAVHYEEPVFRSVHHAVSYAAAPAYSAPHYASHAQRALAPSSTYGTPY